MQIKNLRFKMICIAIIMAVAISYIPNVQILERDVMSFAQNRHDESINLEELDLVAERDGVPEPMAHKANEIDAAAGAKSNCNESNYDDTAKLCTANCNGYGYAGHHYGEYEIPYKIDITVDSELEVIIDSAAAKWNSTRMHDGTGQIISLVKNGIPRPNRPICNIKYSAVRPQGVEPTTNALHHPGSYGDLTSTEIEIFDTGKNEKIIMHEMGHLLGLADLDDGVAKNSPPDKYHMGSIMGYSSLVHTIQYKDIQGVALFNLRHTDHVFMRYVVLNNYIPNIREICFYCDGFRQRPSTYDSVEISSKATCTHIYQPLVSQGDSHWEKCIKCYSVVKSNSFSAYTTNPCFCQ